MMFVRRIIGISQNVKTANATATQTVVIKLAEGALTAETTLLVIVVKSKIIIVYLWFANFMFN